MVSLRLSPLETLEEEPLMLMTSADSRLPASSKEDWVRVDASRKTLMIVRPRRVGTFLMGREAISRNPSLRRKRFSISVVVRSSMEMRCIVLPFRPRWTRLKVRSAGRLYRPAETGKSHGASRAARAAAARTAYSAMATSSTPSISTRRTTTSSLRLVGTFLPTKSGRMGRSRCPRSTSTARRTATGRP